MERSADYPQIFAIFQPSSQYLFFKSVKSAFLKVRFPKLMKLVYGHFLRFGAFWPSTFLFFWPLQPHFLIDHFLIKENVYTVSKFYKGWKVSQSSLNLLLHAFFIRNATIRNLQTYFAQNLKKDLGPKPEKHFIKVVMVKRLKITFPCYHNRKKTNLFSSYSHFTPIKCLEAISTRF